MLQEFQKWIENDRNGLVIANKLIKHLRNGVSCWVYLCWNRKWPKCLAQWDGLLDSWAYGRNHGFTKQDIQGTPEAA